MNSTNKNRVRLRLAAGMIALGFGALIWRLYGIQIVDHERFLESATAMHSSFRTVPAYRGTIRDQGGVILARDVLDHSVGLDPSFFPDDKLQQVIRLVCDAAGKSPEYRRERLRVGLLKKASGGRYLHLLDDVGEDLVGEIREALTRICSREEQNGFVDQLDSHRTYPRDAFAASIVGVVDATETGIEGVESTLEAYLSGRDGGRRLSHDATRSLWFYNPANAEVAPVRGYDVYLTIDSRLQAIVEEELEASVRREKAEAGSFVLMNCRTGDILAMASYPTYDPNHYAEYPKKERESRRKNRVLENLVEAGSVVKPFLAAYVLDTGFCLRDQLVETLVVDPISWDGKSPHARFGRRVVRDVSSHENLTLERAIIFSSNVCMGIVGYRVGEKGLRNMLDRFGLCRKTGIELPAEGEAAAQDADKWKPIYTSVSIAFGYEMMVTPIQLCRALAAVVNGGYLLKPRIVDRIRRGAEEIEYPSRVVVGRPISEETSRQMREILHRVVEEGTARLLKISGFDYGGKTGTAYMASGGYMNGDYLASFEAFAPYEDPEVVALCMIEKPRAGSHYGGRVAGPVVAEVFRRMFGIEETTRLSRILGTQEP